MALNHPASRVTDTLALADDLTVTRMGYGAMQLPGPGAWGPPRDHEAAVRVLRRAVELGITHIDTAEMYGPHVANHLIREALHPYPEDLHIVTKVGFRREPDRSWVPALSRDELVQTVHDNLDHLGLDVLDVVNLRVGAALTRAEGSLAEPFGVLAELREQGLIRHLGVSNVTAAQFAEAQAIAPIVCVQNSYNLSHREDDALVDACAAEGIGFTAFYPLGGNGRPVTLPALDTVAARHGASRLQVALAWLLHRSPTMLLIPGTSSIEHLEENVAATELTLSPEDLAALNHGG